MTSQNPLRAMLDNELPEMDFGVMQYGFASHGRDYVFVVEIGGELRPGTYELAFTHVVKVDYETRVRAETWQRSWGDEFINYQAWEAAGEPDGYVFGTNWSLAYPGVTILEENEDAIRWSKDLDRPMHAAQIETDRFSIVLVYAGVRMRKISSDASTVSKVVIPLPPAWTPPVE